MDLFGFVGDLASGLVNSLFGYNTNSHQQNKQNDFNLQLYKMQREDALADRAHMEAYNSPKNQMSLYRQGGLNPNLAYSQLGTMTTSLPNKVSAEGAAGYTPYKMNLPSVQQALINDATIKNIKADTELKDSQRGLNEQRGITEQERRYNIAKQTEILSKRVKYEGFREVYYEQLAHSEWMLNGFKAETAGYISDYWKERAKYALDEIQAGLNLLKSETNKNYKQIVMFGVQSAMYKNLSALYHEEAEFTEEKTEHEKKKKTLTEKEIEIKSEEVNKIIIQNGISALTFQKLEKLLPGVTWEQYVGILKDFTQSIKNVQP